MTTAPLDPPPLSTRGRTGAALLILLFVGMATWGAWTKSDTYDEPMYLLAGYSYVVTGDLSFNREHPPLAKLLIGLPLLFLDLELPDGYQTRAGVPMAFLFSQPRADHHLMLFLARLPGILLGVVLCLYVLRWGRLAFGRRAGLVALALTATNPNLLAHCRVAGTDFAVTVFCLASLYHLWRWLGTGRIGSLALLGVMLGLAVGSKFTALLLGPLVAGVVLVEAVRRREPALLGGLALAGMSALGVLFLLYGGEARSLEDARGHVRFGVRGQSEGVFGIPAIEETLESAFGSDTPIPLLTFLKGLDLQLHHARSGHPTYFMGEVGTRGFWDFYLVNWLVKNPEALTLLLILGLLAIRRTQRSFALDAPLIGFPVLMFIVFSRADVQLGLKYILPVVPFLCLIAARAFGDRPVRPGMVSDPPGGPWLQPLAARGTMAGVLGVSLGCLLAFDRGPTFHVAHLAPMLLPVAYALLVFASPRRPAAHGAVSLARPLSLLLVWAVIAGLARQPDALMYFNEWTGGPDNGWKVSVIGDDWGQDTRALGLWMEEQELDFIRYDYYGEGDPEAWGVTSIPTFAAPRTFVPFAGIVAVHVSWLARLPDSYFWLEGKQPVTKINHTIFVYEITEGERVDALMRMLTGPRGERLEQDGEFSPR